MPLLTSNYHPSSIFKNADTSTIYAGKLRKVDLSYTRERITLSDGDFIDLDWSHCKGNSELLVILLHGLAGSANRPYMQGMARAFNDMDWDAVAMNFRGCSEEMNRYFQSYHAGASDDLAEVITHVLSLDKYHKIALVGFSLGGNLLMKYLGENRSRPEQILGAAGVSVPCDLAGSLGAINRTRNFIYSKRFEINLKQHLLKRAQKFPDHLDRRKIASCKSLRDIDELYTSRAHGYKNADDYYAQASAQNFLQNIEVPTLLISAKNDSFLSAGCYPVKLAENSEKINLDMPAFGGHVGFVDKNNCYYHEKRIASFMSALLD
ncbi:YheT family hydrolase [Christiangramia portivictoriae]|uniref:YheT family hydrolase n=1 Tax=Christiangramia portivictoriae TaxID=326069 RepID=UPI000427B7FE|nr:alpha/beta fold hydrolase [Christiangramia portivictoriae]